MFIKNFIFFSFYCEVNISRAALFFLSFRPPVIVANMQKCHRVLSQQYFVNLITLRPKIDTFLIGPFAGFHPICANFLHLFPNKQLIV
jgi:hypothetical protein